MCGVRGADAADAGAPHGEPELEQHSGVASTMSGVESKKRDLSAMESSSTEFKVPNMIINPSNPKKRPATTSSAELLSDAEARKAASAEVKRLLAQLERTFLENSEQRLAFADEASNFLQSELALDDAVKECVE